jgi:simple sugar transport system permease protein
VIGNPSAEEHAVQGTGAVQADRYAPVRLFLAGALRTSIALLVALGATVLTVHLAHGNVALALTSLWQGAFGNSYSVGTTLIKTIPLLLTGLGVGIAFRAQMFNIGGEGQFLVGGLLASCIALNIPETRHLSAPALLTLMMIGGCAAGALWAGICAVLKTTRGVPEVISTIMLNFVAAELLSFLVNGPMERLDHSQPATDALQDAATLPIIWSGTPLHAGLIIAIAAAVVVWILINRTVLGFAIDIVGSNPIAARTAGYSVGKTLICAMLWSGALCGLAGAVELSGVVGFIPEGYSPGYGYTAIAVALLGRLNVFGIVLSALLFGALSAGSENMERTAGIGHELGYVIQAVALIVLLAGQWDGWRHLVIRRR